LLKNWEDGSGISEHSRKILTGFSVKSLGL